MPQVNQPISETPPSRNAHDHLSALQIEVPNEILEAFDDRAADVPETPAMVRHRGILVAWNAGDRFDKIAKLTRASKDEIWRVLCRALDFRFDIPLPEGAEEPPVVFERRPQIDQAIIDRFDAAASRVAPNPYLDRNCNILLLRQQGVSADGVGRAVRGVTPAIVWDVERRARNGRFESLVEKQRAGRRGRRATIVALLNEGRDPEEVRKTMGVHGSTIWRAMQQVLPQNQKRSA